MKMTQSTDISRNQADDFGRLVKYERIFCEINRLDFKAVNESFLCSPTLIEDGQHEQDTQIEKLLKSRLSSQYRYIFYDNPEYPAQVKELEVNVNLLYYSGELRLSNSNKIVAVVGSRNASQRGIETAKFVAKRLAENGFTIVSGLAAGIDTAALTSAMDSGGKVIGVIGTPIDEVYPKENINLQSSISSEHLLISQVPIALYKRLHWKIKRGFFTERNKVMAALSIATIIVEASETSGTRIQARECRKLGRKLIFLSPAVDNPKVRWPKALIGESASLATTYSEIATVLGG